MHINILVIMEQQAVTPKRKRIPYGIMNFVAVREDDCYYVDKTRFIEKVENANKFFFFIRPRRFGKSLTTLHKVIVVYRGTEMLTCEEVI